MEKQPLDTANLIPYSLLSTSVFERSKKASSANATHASSSHHSTSIAIPRTFSGPPTESLFRKDQQNQSQDLSSRTQAPRGEAVEMDPFVQGQSRRGRQLYEGTSHQTFGEQHTRPMHDDMHRTGGKRRVQSTSPEPRKRPAGSNGAERSSRPSTSSSAIELSPVLSGSTMLTGSIAIMSPLASSASEDEFGRNRGGQPHHSNSDHNTGNVVDSGRSPRRRSKSSQRWGKRSSSSKSRNSKRRRTGKDNSGSSSSSSSSDSDTGSSSSEDSGHESYAPNGSSALRLHGIIHDLMLDLERARTRHAKYCEKVKVSARKVRNISKKLERHFRNLSESTLSAPASTEHPPMVHRTSNASEGSMPTVAMMPMRTSSQSSIVDRRAQPYSTATPQQHVPNPPRQRVTSQSMLSPTIERRPSGSSSNIRLAQTHNDRMTAIASADVIETLTNIHADVRNKAFGRKPRNMVLHDSIAGADLEDVLVTGSLEGSVDFWDLSNRRVVSTIPKDRLNQPWAEAMCWVGKNVLGVASAHKEGVQLNHQLLLVHVEKGRVPRASLGQTGTSVSWSVQTLSAMPHDGKGIACISSISDDADGMSLVTGGMDKQLMHWRFGAGRSDGRCAPVQQQRIHSKHTSSVQTVCYSPRDKVLYSGGSDCKVVGWDMIRSEVVMEFKSKEGRINSILQNPADPHLFLVCQALTSNQLSLHDSRQRFERAVLCFGADGADRLSKQVQPSWHPNGAIVSCGMQTESKINIWDIRWKDVRRGAGQSIDVHDKRVFKAAFHPKHSFMTSMSAEGSLGFIDFRLNPGTIVHR